MRWTEFFLEGKTMPGPEIIVWDWYSGIQTDFSKLHGSLEVSMKPNIPAM
jgi:hypothetical protein